MRGQLVQISIHAPREGGDVKATDSLGTTVTFQSTPPARGATWNNNSFELVELFQSTPPARGATAGCNGFIFRTGGISIHAPREGGDGQG